MNSIIKYEMNNWHLYEATHSQQPILKFEGALETLEETFNINLLWGTSLKQRKWMTMCAIQ
jgi:hypothetical protein